MHLEHKLLVRVYQMIGFIVTFLFVFNIATGTYLFSFLDLQTEFYKEIFVVYALLIIYQRLTEKNITQAELEATEYQDLTLEFQNLPQNLTEEDLKNSIH